ncbi:1-phosphofructokinase family hexose kinase [Brachybacterium aquaticum]|uniref:1-phosphofructokinase family hexose kinase n=1 Tax=Brachybacterium aquaticum TaxID=1432564 RepID=A0A841AAY2_9MICO|nr:1-phosphofructokinase family hexose kinase [Brachybacterium aquaticum]MBB5830791.1 1-phosphofructokinase family hexose kinase [Brachybacterium aquaticum]
MILTFTANPSLDRTVELPGPLVPGGVHRIGADRTQPGGKGINVALGVHRAGLPVLAVLPAAPTDPLLGLLEVEGLPHRASPVAGRVRTNLTVLSSPGQTTKLNEPGAELSAPEVDGLERLLLESTSPGDSVMLSGSLAPGLPADEYVRLVTALRARGARVGVDTSDAPLAALASALDSAAPDFLKPNAEELGQILGADGAALEAEAAEGRLDGVAAAALDLHRRGVGAVLVTLGGAGGLLATEGAAWYSPSAPVPVVSTVGAGDSATAGYLIARALEEEPPLRLARSLAYGTAAVALPGTTIPRPDQVRIDATRVVRL